MVQFLTVPEDEKAEALEKLVTAVAGETMAAVALKKLAAGERSFGYVGNTPVYLEFGEPNRVRVDLFNRQWGEGKAQAILAGDESAPDEPADAQADTIPPPAPKPKRRKKKAE